MAVNVVKKLVLEQGSGAQTPLDGAVCSLTLNYCHEGEHIPFENLDEDEEEKRDGNMGENDEIPSGKQSPTPYVLVLGDNEAEFGPYLDFCIATMTSGETSDFMFPATEVPESLESLRLEVVETFEVKAAKNECHVLPADKPKVPASKRQFFCTPEERSVTEPQQEMEKVRVHLRKFENPPIESWKMSPQEKFDCALHHKTNGTILYKQSCTKAAFWEFSIAGKLLICMGNDDEVPKELLDNFQSLKTQVFLNIAACQLFYENYEYTVQACDTALQLDPQNVKGLFRRGQANVKLRNFDAAYQNLKTASEVEPDNRAVKHYLFHVMKILKIRA